MSQILDKLQTWEAQVEEVFEKEVIGQVREAFTVVSIYSACIGYIGDAVRPIQHAYLVIFVLTFLAYLWVRCLS